MSLERVRRIRLAWYFEAPLLVIGYVAFGFARAAVYRGDGPATSTAVFVQRLEQILRIAVEYPLNHAMVWHPVAIYVVGYFYRICVVAVPAVLIWLYVTHSARYRRLLLVLVVAMLLDVLLVWLFPESPPRMAQTGIVDHMATYDILGGAASRNSNRAANPLAAMPSMHIAWTTWCAYAVWSERRQRSAWLVPLLTALVVLVTGHHYVLDILAGVALVALSIGLVQLAYKRRCTKV